MIGRLALAAGTAVASAVVLRGVGRRATDRLLDAPRVRPEEARLGPALDALGGEIVRLRARDGLRLGGRWLPAEPAPAEPARAEPARADWVADPHEAIVLLHGWSGSVAPDLVASGPFLRRTAGVLGLDFRGHGDSEDGPSTFGVFEVEDVAGALAWLGERGVTRVALVGSSMGGITALAAVVVLGDGALPSADIDPAAAAHVVAAPRPRIVGVVAESVPPELEIPVANRLRGPASRFLAARLFDDAARRLGADPRATQPAAIIGLVDPVPLLLIHGEADATVPIADGRRLAALAGPSAEHWVVPGADHSAAHAAAGEDYERRVTDFLRVAFDGVRAEHPGGSGSGPIIAAPGAPSGARSVRAPGED